MGIDRSDRVASQRKRIPAEQTTAMFDDQLTEISREHPAFAGLYVDEPARKLMILMADQA